MKTATTIVATVDLRDINPDVAVARIRRALHDLGAEIVPCGWAPDPDTIAACVGADRVTILDLND